MRRCFVSAILLATLTSLAPAAGEFDLTELDRRVRSVVDRVLPAVVSCRIKDAPSGSFSAVIVSSEGHVLTAAHCVTVRPPGTGKSKKKLTYVLTLTDGRTAEAEALGFDRKLDCALMKITQPGEWPVAEMGESSGLVKFQPCVSISHPAGFNSQRGAVVRFGYINETITERAGMIQSTCLTEPGDSGGPLFDLDGRIIGIHSQIDKDLERNYHVRISAYHEHWEKLNKAGQFSAATTPGIPPLGFRARFQKQGLTVDAVTLDSVAAAAGLNKDDIVVSVDGTKIRSVRHFNKEYIKLVRAGRTEIPIVLQTDEQQRDATLRLPARAITLNEPMPEIAVLPAELSDLEDRLDDSTFVVSSISNNQSISVCATLIDAAGRLVSKSSRVGTTPVIKLRTGDRLSTRVLRRNQEHDLVLLQCEALRGREGLSLERPDTSVESSQLSRGQMLLSPDPRGPGFVSVVGSADFGSERSRGYLGVRMQQSEGKVVLQGLDPRGPAAKAGLRKGDILVSLNGTQVTNNADVTRFMKKHQSGRSIGVVVERDGLQLGKRIRLSQRDVKRHAADFLSGGKSQRRDGFEIVFTHDATLQPSECGTPVCDITGQVVGLNIARHSRAQCYAVPVRAVRDFAAGVESPE